MPAISFTVFKDKILNGTKTQTIRKLRKHPIKKGQRLYLYWHLRKKDCEKLGETICTDVFTIRLESEYWLGKQRLKIDVFSKDLPDRNGWKPLWKTLGFGLSVEEMVEIIHRDGFQDADEMLSWFSSHYPLPELFQVIRWEKLNGERSNETQRKGL